jgi:hypothetical protein
VCRHAQLLRSNDHVYLVERRNRKMMALASGWSEVPYPRAVTPLSHS